jgi:diadenosine tetraphosphatase ApaH/serine/threonine PP2A family protein phosphatase
LRLDIEGLGEVLFCHATPRSETEVFTRLTQEDRLLPLFEGLGTSLAVCGHTHLQFDRRVGSTRVVNAGSVGEPNGATGAFWLILGPDVEFRRTDYDLVRAGEQIRATSFPRADAFADGLLHPPAEEEVLELYAQWELK